MLQFWLTRFIIRQIGLNSKVILDEIIETKKRQSLKKWAGKFVLHKMKKFMLRTHKDINERIRQHIKNNIKLSSGLHNDIAVLITAKKKVVDFIQVFLKRYELTQGIREFIQKSKKP